MFQKRHYWELVKALQAIKPRDRFEDEGEGDGFFAHGMSRQWRNTVDSICDMLKRDNPRFERQFFIEAVDGKRKKGSPATRNGEMRALK